MTSLSPTARVILGMVRLGRRTGYDIKALVDRSTRFFWAASYGQIYPELKRLEERGLVRGSDEPVGDRRRVEYELTDAGDEELRAWLASDADLTYELRDEGLLKFFFGDAMSTGEMVEHLRSMRARHEGIVGSLREIEPAARAAAEEHGRRFPYRTLLGGIELHGFMADWCRRMEEEVTAEAAAATGGRRTA